MSMFCHQCQETAKNNGCTVQGVCGKKEEVANLQDLFIWTLKGISVWGVKGKEFDIYDEQIAFFIDKGLFATITNANFDRTDFLGFIKQGLIYRDRLKAQVLQAYSKAHGREFSG
ncbi:MAG: hydroxylamine reductase, partial [Desulfoprunum sp.]|nr:hydroxylamine reductase [Desulfoprunum sp.]